MQKQIFTKESLFTKALGLQDPWDVEKIEFFEVPKKETYTIVNIVE